MKTELQIAEGLYDDWCEIIAHGHEMSKCSYDKHLFELDKQVKSNLEGLGCRKQYYKTRIASIYDVRTECNNKDFCPDCLAKGVDKAKEIYEEILK